MVAAITGAPSPYVVGWKAPSTADTSCGAASCPWPVIQHTCTATDGSFADPPCASTSSCASSAPTARTLSICDDDFSPALSQHRQRDRRIRQRALHPGADREAAGHDARGLHRHRQHDPRQLARLRRPGRRRPGAGGWSPARPRAVAASPSRWREALPRTSPWTAPCASPACPTRRAAAREVGRSARKPHCARGQLRWRSGLSTARIPGGSLARRLPTFDDGPKNPARTRQDCSPRTALPIIAQL